MDGRTISTAAGQLRQSATPRGRGWTRLVKPQQPAAGANFVRVIPGDFWERVLGVALQVALAAIGGSRQAVLQWMDGDGFVWAQAPLTPLLAPSTIAQVFGDQGYNSPFTSDQSITSQGSALNPGAFGGVTFTSSLPAGTYQVQATVMLTGTVAAGDGDNMEIVFGGAAAEVIDYPAVVNAPVTYTTEIELLAAHTIGVQTIAASSGGGVTYVAELIVTPVASLAYYGAIPDFLMKSAWQLGVTIPGIQAGDQISAIGLLLEQYPAGGQYMHEHGLAAELMELAGRWSGG